MQGTGSLEGWREEAEIAFLWKWLKGMLQHYSPSLLSMSGRGQSRLQLRVGCIPSACRDNRHRTPDSKSLAPFCGSSDWRTHPRSRRHVEFMQTDDARGTDYEFEAVRHLSA